MNNSNLPFELMSVYDNKMLATRAELALMRVTRTRKIEDNDIKAFKMLGTLLEYAKAGDTAVSGAQLVASSEQSLEVLMETIQALVEKTPAMANFREALNQLKLTSDTLASKKIPPVESIKQLQSFVHNYALVQSDLIKERSTSPNEATVWPLLTRLGYSSPS